MDNPQGTLKVTEAELGWLGGIIDGEGTVAFSVYFRDTTRTIRVKPQIIICGTDKPVIEKAAEIIGRLGVGVHVSERSQSRDPNSLTGMTPKYRPLHVATVDGFKRASALLSIIRPYLFSCKGEKARLILRYSTARLAKTSQCVGRLGGYPQDEEDLTNMLAVLRFSEVHNGKGPGPKYIKEVERLLRDLKHGRTRDS